MTPQTSQPGAPSPTRTGSTIPNHPELTFHITVDDKPIGQFAECTGLAVEYDVTEYVEGGNNEFVHKLRGGVRYPNVTLKRGVTFEDALIKWFYETKAPDQRPTLTIKLLDSMSKPVRVFALSGALPVRWTGPTATSSSNNAATESLEIAHRGFV